MPDSKISALVARLPSHDKEVPKSPAPKPVSGKFTGPDRNLSDELVLQVLAEGAAGLDELIALIRDPASAEYVSHKAEYLLHCVVVHAGSGDQQSARRLVVDVLAAALPREGLAPYVRGLLIRELQWIGDAPAIEAVARLLVQPEHVVDATACLLSLGGDAAGKALHEVWPKSPAACHVPILHALATLRFAAALPIFREALKSNDPDLKLIAAWAVAQLGDEASADALFQLAEGEPSFTTIQAANHCLLLADTLAAAGKTSAAASVYKRLRDASAEPHEKHLHDLAARALAAGKP